MIKVEGKWKTVILISTGVLGYLLWKFGPSTFMGNVFKYIFFFNLGIVLWRHYETIINIFKSYAAIITLICVFVLECPYLRLKPEYIITAILGSYAIITFAIKINSNKEKKLFSFLNFAGDFSYDIYMMSYFVQVPVRVICWRILGWNYLIDVLLMFTLGFILPCLVSKYIVRRVSVFRKLFVGDWK